MCFQFVYLPKLLETTAVIYIHSRPFILGDFVCFYSTDVVESDRKFLRRERERGDDMH